MVGTNRFSVRGGYSLHENTVTSAALGGHRAADPRDPLVGPTGIRVATRGGPRTAGRKRAADPGVQAGQFRQFSAGSSAR